MEWDFGYLDREIFILPCIVKSLMKRRGKIPSWSFFIAMKFNKSSVNEILNLKFKSNNDDSKF